MKITSKGITASVLAYCNPQALYTLQTDIRYADFIVILAFKVQQEFFIETFGRHLENHPITMLCHHSNRLVVSQIIKEFPHLTAWYWPENRMMHSKVICMPEIGTTWIGSHNLTRYSWTSSQNVSTRIDCSAFAYEVVAYIRERISRSLPIFPYQPTE
jgi:hypothetical protein